jgi:hypothetical protein
MFEILIEVFALPSLLEADFAASSECKRFKKIMSFR